MQTTTIETNDGVIFEIKDGVEDSFVGGMRRDSYIAVDSFLNDKSGSQTIPFRTNSDYPYYRVFVSNTSKTSYNITLTDASGKNQLTSSPITLGAGTVTYNPAERKTATGNAGTATIYWVDAHMVTWGITSNAGGAMVFTGTVSTNRGQIFVLGDIEFDGDCGGTIDNVTTLKGKNTATLSGFMIDSRGISITAPDVSSNYYR